MKRRILNVSRQMGKSNFVQIARYLESYMKNALKLKIVWKPRGRLSLTATMPAPGPRGFELGLSERDMDPIQKWCEEHHCGIRTSFDTFRFRNQKEKMMFLLRWGH